MSKIAEVRVVGPLEPYARGFAAELARQGWTSGSGAHQLWLLAHLSRWLDEQGLDATALTSRQVVERFAAMRRTAGYSVHCSPRALSPLLGYLRGLGVVGEEEPAAVTPVEALLGRYANYLVHRRGLAPSSVPVYVGAVRGFVAALVVDGRVELEGLSAAGVTAFMLAACTPRQPGKAKTTATALRSLLGFLHAEGLVASALAGAVPRVASWQQAALPRDLEPAEVRRLLASCDRRTSLGRRDYAILLLLARLGLRAGEVARLELDHIDWRAGELLVRGKGGRAELLPQFVDYLEQAGAARVTVEHALAWATLPSEASPRWRAERLSVVRSFASWLAAIDPETEIPPAGLLPCPRQRAVPYLYCDGEVAALLAATDTIRSRLRAVTYRTLIGLLSVTGMRIGEALALDRADADLRRGLLVVRSGKFDKARELHLHDTTVGALRGYLRLRDRLRPDAVTATPALFITTRGSRLGYGYVKTTFRQLVDRAGLKARSAACRPRLHDLRHSFAVNSLLDAYRSGADVHARLPLIATWLGHADPTKGSQTVFV